MGGDGELETCIKSDLAGAEEFSASECNVLESLGLVVAGESKLHASDLEVTATFRLTEVQLNGHPTDNFQTDISKASEFFSNKIVPRLGFESIRLGWTLKGQKFTESAPNAFSANLKLRQTDERQTLAEMVDISQTLPEIDVLKQSIRAELLGRSAAHDLKLRRVADDGCGFLCGNGQVFAADIDVTVSEANGDPTAEAHHVRREIELLLVMEEKLDKLVATQEGFLQRVKEAGYSENKYIGPGEPYCGSLHLTPKDVRDSSLFQHLEEGENQVMLVHGPPGTELCIPDPFDGIAAGEENQATGNPLLRYQAYLHCEEDDGHLIPFLVAGKKAKQDERKRPAALQLRPMKRKQRRMLRKIKWQEIVAASRAGEFGPKCDPSGQLGGLLGQRALQFVQSGFIEQRKKERQALEEINIHVSKQVPQSGKDDCFGPAPDKLLPLVQRHVPGRFVRPWRPEKWTLNKLPHLLQQRGEFVKSVDESEENREIETCRYVRYYSWSAKRAYFLDRVTGIVQWFAPAGACVIDSNQYDTFMEMSSGRQAKPPTQLDSAVLEAIREQELLLKTKTQTNAKVEASPPELITIDDDDKDVVRVALDKVSVPTPSRTLSSGSKPQSKPLTKPDSAFRIFCKENEHLVAKDAPGMVGRALSRRMNDLWNMMPPEEKLPYRQKEMMQRQEYERRIQLEQKKVQEHILQQRQQHRIGGSSSLGLGRPDVVPSTSSTASTSSLNNSGLEHMNPSLAMFLEDMEKQRLLEEQKRLLLQHLEQDKERERQRLRIQEHERKFQEVVKYCAERGFPPSYPRLLKHDEVELVYEQIKEEERQKQLEQERQRQEQQQKQEAMRLLYQQGIDINQLLGSVGPYQATSGLLGSGVGHLGGLGSGTSNLYGKQVGSGMRGLSMDSLDTDLLRMYNQTQQHHLGIPSYLQDQRRQQQQQQQVYHQRQPTYSTTSSSSSSSSATQEEITKDAHAFLSKVRNAFKFQPHKYDEFSAYMEYFHKGQITPADLVRQVERIFHGHPDLLENFQQFL